MIYFFKKKVGVNPVTKPVFRATWHSKDGPRDVAIKHFETEGEKEEFNIERKQLARVKHPNIIQMYGACRYPYVLLVMEFAECGSLYKVLHQSKPAPEYNAGEVIFHVASFFIKYYVEILQKQSKSFKLNKKIRRAYSYCSYTYQSTNSTSNTTKYKHCNCNCNSDAH